jgi:hypothetical protein
LLVHGEPIGLDEAAATLQVVLDWTDPSIKMWPTGCGRSSTSRSGRSAIRRLIQRQPCRPSIGFMAACARSLRDRCTTAPIATQTGPAG